MKLTTIRTLTLAALAVASLSACAPLVVGGAVVGTALVTTDRRTTGTQVEDTGIETKATYRIRQALGSRTNINAQAFNRVLLLTGEVRNDADKAEAERIAAGVENVIRVVNEIEVGFISSLTSRSNDLVLAGKIKATLIDARDLQSNAFDVVVERGEVYLMGLVTEREAHRATELIRGIPGVKKVVRVLEVISEEELARRVPPRPSAEQSK
ncbi:MAG: BON domain-containing protein [Inhella sp.]|jgi:osmotically-inducible protein OsmY|uniref:BON domain-containing protein n=1 Tax=Inhella sp. TaxID=1921806 RepID=UPI0022BB1D2D|nr:BON domain-containing protein [Inhella sp.]MCZ8235229.1 BON domain-containing protein [Inhella sp.]